MFIDFIDEQKTMNRFHPILTLKIVKNR